MCCQHIRHLLTKRSLFVLLSETAVRTPRTKTKARQTRAKARAMVKLTYTGEVRRNFDVGETIGRGSFATVKLCTDIMTKQQFALKVVNKGDPAFEQKNLAEEVDAMMRVSHPNCVHLHGVFEEKEKIYLVLDLVTGGTLMDRIIEMNHFSEKDAIHVTRDILLAVEYLHSIGITHRDLKPENLLYASGDPSSPDYNTIKIADFGLAKVMSGRSTMSTPCGTPNYVAPEVIDPARGSKVYGPEIDIWSVGVIVYVMLCGFPPFYQTSTPALFKEICKGEFSFPSPYWDGISQQAKNFVMKTIVKKPRQRMQASECLQHEWIKKGLPHSLSAGSVHSFHKAFLLLRKLDIFESIDPMLLNEIAKVLKTVRARKGEYIIRAGDLGNSMYFVHSGFVEVSVNGNKVDMLTAGAIVTMVVVWWWL
eukprot:765521-Hanusia_phi.AAC.7